MWILICVDSEVGADTISIQREVFSLPDDESVRRQVELKKLVFLPSVIKRVALNGKFAVRSGDHFR